MVDYVALINAELAHHRAEIAKLENALEVVTRLASQSGGKAKPQQPLFTVRKIDGVEPVPRTAKASVREQVITLLRQHPNGLTTSQMRAKIDLSNHAASTLHGVTYALNRDGIATRAKGVYRLATVQEQPAPATEAAA